MEPTLLALLEVFPEHLAKREPPEPFTGDELEQNDQFDALLRAHKKDRLAIPIQALRRTGAPYHGFARMPSRRLAWFVPSLLASWLAHDIDAAELEELLGDDEHEWTAEESAALDAFFEATLDAALAEPLGPAHEPGRPLEDGVQVWSRHSPSRPLVVLRVARAFGVWLDGLVVRWALSEQPLAAAHLLEAIFDTTIASKHFLSHEAVAERMAEAFFDATGEQQLRFSKAETTIRRNIKRREDF